MRNNSLTQHKSGSIAELLAVSWPIVLSGASSYLMIVIDRVILSRYSQDAFNACFCAAQWYMVVYVVLMGLVSISEVFVGQYNGAQEFKRAGPCIWQMLWFCILSCIIIIPFAIFCPQWLLPDNMQQLGVPYLTIIIAFIPFDVIGYAALTGFFVGLGRTKLVPLCALISNLINLILDIILVFGYGPIPEMGIIGAAIATVISQIVFTVILLYIFLQKEYREHYGTNDWKIDFPSMKRCLLIGIPDALNRFLSYLFWTLLVSLIAVHASKDEFSAFSISNSIFLLFVFVPEGIACGTKTVCSNAIGADERYIIFKNARSWMIVTLVSSLIIGIAMVIYPDSLICMFLDHTGAGDVYFLAKHMMLFAWLAFVFDSVFYNFLSMLLAAGDTKFTMLVNVSCFILIAIIPTIVCILVFNTSCIVAWFFMIIDYITRSIIYILRIKSGILLQKSRL